MIEEERDQRRARFGKIYYLSLERFVTFSKRTLPKHKDLIWVGWVGAERRDESRREERSRHVYRRNRQLMDLYR